MKTHLNLNTCDLGASVAFYRTLLNAAPSKQYEDYALFVLENPGLELALSRAPHTQASLDVHYGIAVDAAQLVDSATERLRGAGHAVDVELAETCCYAEQNKVWATDPDGRRWETYYVIAETEERSGQNMTCCQAADDQASCC